MVVYNARYREHAKRSPYHGSRLRAMNNLQACSEVLHYLNMLCARRFLLYLYTGKNTYVQRASVAANGTRRVDCNDEAQKAVENRKDQEHC